MVSTNDGFKIAEKDLELRGPGEMDGTRQSGALLFKLANIVADKVMLQAAMESVCNMLDLDPEMEQPEHVMVKSFLQQQKGKTAWSKIA